MTESFLVIVDVTTSTDGGHVQLLHQNFWVEAENKQAAAASAAVATKELKGNSYVAHNIAYVVSKADWGHKYFYTVAPSQTRRVEKTTRTRIKVEELNLLLAAAEAKE